MADAASLSSITGLDVEAAANLLDAAGGDMEMAVSLHFGGDQADADLYWHEEGDELLDFERGAQEKTAELINRVQTRDQVAEQQAAAAAVKKRDKKSRAKLRREETEALHLVTGEFGEMAAGKESETSGENNLDNDDSDSDSSSDSGSEGSSDEDEWVDEDWYVMFLYTFGYTCVYLCAPTRVLLHS